MIAIINYGMGNLHSVAKAFESLGADAMLISQPEGLQQADKILLPGVGAFADGISNLQKFGFVGPLRVEVLEKRKPILGLCLGMQLLAKDSEEGGLHTGLGFIDAHVRRFTVESRGLKVPHVGWNEVVPGPGAKLFRNLSENPSFYFVHSYHVVCDDAGIIAAKCEYGIEFAAAIQKGNIFGTQFHPEKSQKDGLRLLENFINL